MILSISYDFFDSPRYIGLPYRHTWMCWMSQGGIALKDCEAVDGNERSNGGPLIFKSVKAKPFERILLEDSAVCC